MHSLPGWYLLPSQAVPAKPKAIIRYEKCRLNEQAALCFVKSTDCPVKPRKSSEFIENESLQIQILWYNDMRLVGA